MRVSRREQEFVSIAVPSGEVLSVRVVRARNGAVSLELELPPGHGLCPAVETDCDGRALREMVTETIGCGL